jgi:hypothetical protein
MSNWDTELPDARNMRRGVLPQREREQRVKKKIEGEWLVVCFARKGAKYQKLARYFESPTGYWRQRWAYVGGRLAIQVHSRHGDEESARKVVDKEVRGQESLRSYLKTDDYRRSWYDNWGATRYFYCHRDTFEKMRAALPQE